MNCSNKSNFKLKLAAKRQRVFALIRQHFGDTILNLSRQQAECIINPNFNFQTDSKLFTKVIKETLKNFALHDQRLEVAKQTLLRNLGVIATLSLEPCQLPLHAMAFTASYCICICCRRVCPIKRHAVCSQPD